METHLAIVRHLADGEFHSGQALAAELGISRAAVWKAMRKAAEALDLKVQSVRGRGYRLEAPLELLDAGRILAEMDRDIQRRIVRMEIHDDIDSTNRHLMQEGHAGAPSGTLCLAERQRAGRGRRGRTWVSPFGANLYLSLLWRYACGPAELGGLSLAAGTAVAGVLEREGVAGVGLKWPNDVLWRRHKLAGLLLEIAAEVHGPSLVVVGLGLNTRISRSQAAAIDQPWVDLATIVGPASIGRNRLAAHMAAGLLVALERYAYEGFGPFIPEWDRYDLYRGERVDVHLADQVTTGTHLGITEEGALRVEVDGTVRTFHAGEVSLRTAASASGDGGCE